MCSGDLRPQKSVALFAFIGCSEVFDYLQFPITTSKAHACWRERRCFTPGIVFENVEVSEQPAYKLLRFFYSKVCVSKSRSFPHRHSIWLIINYCEIIFGKITIKYRKGVYFTSPSIFCINCLRYAADTLLISDLS